MSLFPFLTPFPSRGRAHLQRVPLPMKKNELLGPKHIGILGVDAVMQSANTIPHLVE